MAEQTSNQGSQESEARNKDQKQRQARKMVTSTVKDVISKGRTMTGKRPDQIDMNPVKENSDLFKHVSNMYDKFMEDTDRSDTYKREWGTDSLTNMYKKDTPGQTLNKNFVKILGKGKEAVARSEYERNEIDLVPRDPADRKEDTKFYRQQSIQKKIIDEKYGKGYKSPWDKIEKAKPGIGKKIDAAVAGLKQSAADYQAILDKEKAKTKNESVNAAGSGSVRGFGNVSGNPDGVSNSYVNANIADADTKDNLLKTHVKAHHNLHVVGSTEKKIAKEEKINEDLRQWFKDKWVRMDTKGNIKGDCAREPGEGKPKCLPIAKARAMDKDDRAAAARRKRREDPVADRPGKGGAPINVRTEAVEMTPANQVTFGSYTTKHFDICPSAVKLYTGIENKTQMSHLAVENMMLHDLLFRLEKQVVAIGHSDKDDIEKAEHIADLIMTNAKRMRLEKEHSYIEDPHLKTIRDLNTTQSEGTLAGKAAQQAAIAISLIKAGKKKGKDPGPQKEEVQMEEYIEEKNKPTNPALWSRAKALARSKFDVYPSAYANGWAARWYKSKGGGWRSE